MDSLLLGWFIVENVLIPQGFVKWCGLSFFVHPLLLVICQIFLWVKWLGTWITILALLPFRNVWHSILWVFGFVRSRSVDYEVQQECGRCKVVEIRDTVLYDCDRNLRIEYVSKRSDERGFEEEENNKKQSDVYVNGDLDMDESSSLLYSSESPVIERGVENEREDEIDEFYMKYTERMRWFDLLNYERTCGISSILNKQLRSSSLLENIEPMSVPVSHITWSEVDKRKLIRSLQSDFEMVYVGQSCLCWEALYHQYRKVEGLACSNSTRGAFYNNVCGKFQQFQVLLERFMENERFEGKRYWNYVHGRFSHKNLLQVPEVSGYVEEEKEGMKSQATFSKEVLKVIEKSIRTFWVFLKTDSKKSSWKFKELLWAYPKVEDPKDLQLLADLKKALQKKELRLKDLQRRKRCLLKRPNPHEEYHRREILFSMIDLKLVARVLRMSVISTLQLKWCREKLSDIEIVEGKVERACNSCLFPPS
ncbi:uncharacterized protein LOC143849052 [Tasmannia lanceolata]|uniref:uncharacterized protein LOC143849052 n=1 Tax=Tasmannia lanceolata TaxID=3420 RepID=UPI004062F525